MRLPHLTAASGNQDSWGDWNDEFGRDSLQAGTYGYVVVVFAAAARLLRGLSGPGDASRRNPRPRVHIDHRKRVDVAVRSSGIDSYRKRRAWRGGADRQTARPLQVAK